MQVEITSYTPDPERIVAAAARACVVDDDFQALAGRLSEADIHRLLATVIAKGHTSVLEHVNFTFAISGVSRVLSHQLVRHRIASYSQLSQQRVDASDLPYVVPPEVAKDHELAKDFEMALARCQQLYRKLVQQGIPLGSARYILPHAMQTRVIMTMNARSLFNLIAQRACAAEEWEFRQVATLLHRRLMEIAPAIFRFAGTECETHGICPEGEIGQTCGRQAATGAAIENTRQQINELVQG